MRGNALLIAAAVFSAAILIPFACCLGWLLFLRFENQPREVKVDFQRLHVFWLDNNQLRHGTVSAQRAYTVGRRLYIEIRNECPYDITPQKLFLRFYSGHRVVGEDTASLYKEELGEGNRLTPYATTTFAVNSEHPGIRAADKIYASLTDVGDLWDTLLWSFSGVKVDKFRLRNSDPAILIRKDTDRFVSMYEMESLAFRN